jgi:hypothetical protein
MQDLAREAALTAAILLRWSHEYARLVWSTDGRPWEGRVGMRIRSDADAAAAAAVVQRVLHEHGLPFEPRGPDADILAPERDRVPSRPAGGRRRLVLVPSFA